MKNSIFFKAFLVMLSMLGSLGLAHELGDPEFAEEVESRRSFSANHLTSVSAVDQSKGVSQCSEQHAVAQDVYQLVSKSSSTFKANLSLHQVFSFSAVQQTAPELFFVGFYSPPIINPEQNFKPPKNRVSTPWYLLINSSSRHLLSGWKFSNLQFQNQLITA